VVAGSPQNGPAEEHLHAQRGGLSIAGHTAGTLEFPQQVEQHQNAQEGRLGGKNSRRQKSSAARSDFNSSIRCSMQARWL